MEDVVLSFKNFGFQYNAQAEPTLHDISFDLRRGEKILIAGASGCGKSTLVHCINGLIPFCYKGEKTGSLTVKGRETSEMSIFELSKSVGTVLQDSDGQFVGLTVAEDIAFALENDCVGEPELHDRVAEAADLVGIGGHLRKAPAQLSGGQKQRVSLAGVMVDDVDIFLFDEPLANLDPATGKQAVELIDEIQQRTGAAVIIVEHRLEDALWRHVDRVVLMDDGRIVADESPDELLSGDLLQKYGIREPLYITALKYAGVRIRPEMRPWSINSIELSEDDRTKLREWFEQRGGAAARPERDTLLSAKNISFGYDKSRMIINNITVDIHKDELTAIVGTNGAGKSTFAKLICGFENQNSGCFFLGDTDLKDLSIKERADHIGYVMQNPNQMISKVMIFDEIALGLRKRGISEDVVKEKVEKVLEICGLRPFRKWPVSALSYGQKKRVTIASILVLEPDMIILDEPTAGQDYRHYTDIMEFLLELKARGITILLITHDMHLMLEYAERTIVFSDGRIIADSTGDAVLTDRETIKKASLKETSLYALAEKCGIADAKGFVKSFIDYEREVFRN